MSAAHSNPPWHTDELTNRKQTQMATATGVVKYVNEKAGLHNIVLEDGTRLGFFKTKPTCAVGDSVTVEYISKGDFNNAKPETLVVARGKPTAAAPQGATGSDVRQDSIIWQSARNAGIELLAVLVEAEAIKLPAKQADKYDAMMALLSELTVRFVGEAKNLKIQDSEMAPTTSKFSEED